MFGGNIGERALLLAGGGGNGIDGVRLQRDGKGAIIRFDAGLLDELRGGVAAPHAELAGGQAAADVEGDVLGGLGILGFENHAVIFARRFQRDKRAAAGQLSAGAVEIHPADF